MTAATLWAANESFILTQIEVFNWGGFQGLHQATIDPAGTAIIGPTGSGKTTLVDALMTLLCANPRYNLASTGGHESDRDLVSYVRGVSGPGDGGPGQSHISRPGKTVTGVAATLKRDGQQVRLGALLWFEGTSSTASDMKKLWLFSDDPMHTLEHWLNLHHDGGMRSLRQMEKDGTGIWTWPNKKSYLARLRDYFEVGENAFTLLNRAAGLKQLNSIDDIFRELVLDDRSAFERAAEVAGSFDDLTDIHQELETARKQQRSLQPIADGWSRHQARQVQLDDKMALEALLPVWFAEQAFRMWLAEAARLESALAAAQTARTHLQTQLETQKKQVTECMQRYLQVGGANIDDLNERIKEWENTCNRREGQAAQYQQLTRNLGLTPELNQAAFQANRQSAQARLEGISDDIKTKEHEAYQKGAIELGLTQQRQALLTEKTEVERRPGSNLPALYQAFRGELAMALGLVEAALPFVAELIQVKPEEQAWRGAIERAIGSHRLRILVQPESAKEALRWVNQRHNRLHVRLLEATASQSRPVFLNDGFTRKLIWKDHPWKEAVKVLLAGIDRHCLERPEQLRDIPHAMTRQGMMSGKTGFYDKQDQKRLEDDWLTGFDNRDRLAFLNKEIGRFDDQLNVAGRELRAAKGAVGELQTQARILESLGQLVFEDIDLAGARQQLTELKARLEKLLRPESDAMAAKYALGEAQERQGQLERQLQLEDKRIGGLEKSLEEAALSAQKIGKVAETGMTDTQRELAAKHLSLVENEQLRDIPSLERDHARELQKQIDEVKDQLQKLGVELTKRMSDAQKIDTGALSEVGRELEDVPLYLKRLQELTEEALPEKLNRFIEYLNRSSDDGVTQLLSHIEHEVLTIEDRLHDLNNTMLRVDFQPERYLQLVAKKVVHESLRTLQRAQRQLNAARFTDDNGESQYKALRDLVGLLKDACERNRTQGARALLDPRFRLEFAVSVIDRNTGEVIETRTGSQGGSGGEKEIIASYVLTASLSYALCPDGSSCPLFGTIVLDEAFSRSSHAVAGRIIAALREFGLHAVFITPNKEMRLLRHHTRSAIVVHRREQCSNMVSLSWEELEQHNERRSGAA